MRKSVVFALAVLLTTASAGCGDDPKKPTTEKPTTESRRARFAQRAEQIVKDWPDIRPVRRYHSDMLPIEKAKRPLRDDRGLTVNVGHGACDKDHGAWVHEGSHVVVVAGWAVKDKKAQVCTKQLRIDPVKVRLERALGHRTVVDAATGKELLPR